MVWSHIFILSISLKMYISSHFDGVSIFHSNFKCFSMERKTLFYETWHDNNICGLLIFSTMFGIQASLLIFFEEVWLDLQHSIAWQHQSIHRPQITGHNNIKKLKQSYYFYKSECIYYILLDEKRGDVFKWRLN